MIKLPVVYMMANKKNGTIYTGVTSNLAKRVHEHRNSIITASFTRRYSCNILVYYEQCPSMLTAIEREKTIKGGSRQNKINLIESINPEWRDLFDDINRFQ